MKPYDLVLADKDQFYIYKRPVKEKCRLTLTFQRFQETDKFTPAEETIIL